MNRVQRFAWIPGLLVLVAEIAFVWVPASKWGGHLDVEAAVVMTLVGFGLIMTTVIAKLAQLDRQSNGGVMFVLKAFGVGYLGYKVGIGVARHIHQEITKE